MSAPGQTRQSATYRGHDQPEATRLYHADALRAADLGFVPIAEVWSQALGQQILTVTYEHRPHEVDTVRAQILRVTQPSQAPGPRPGWGTPQPPVAPVAPAGPGWVQPPSEQAAGRPGRPSRRGLVLGVAVGLLFLGALGALAGGGSPRGTPGLTQGAGQPTQQPTREPTAPRPTETPEPTTAWPSDWEVFMCAAIREYSDAGSHLDKLSQAAAVFDIEDLITEAKAADQDLKEAIESAGYAPSWAAGEPARKALLSSAREMRKALNSVILAAETLDPEALDESSRLLEAAQPGIVKVGDLAGALRASTGFGC